MPRGTESSKAVSIEIVKVTPKQANTWLECNEVNRPLRQRIVGAYRRDMEAGDWSFTAEPIQISRTGRLLNGQHRLTALATSKGVKSLELVVATGLPDETQSMMDQGVARRLTDALTLSHGHVKNVTLVASLSRWLTLCPQITSDMTHSSLRGKVTTAQALATFEANPDIGLATERAVTYRNFIDGSPTAVGYTWLHMNRINPEAAEEFFGGMADMEWSWKHDPRKAALRRLQIIHRDNEVKTSLETGVMLISVFSRAWNAWRKGEEIETLPARNKTGPIAPVELIP